MRGTGVVIVKENRILLGARSDGQGWSLPGGKIEMLETKESAAVREVLEEVGLVVDEKELLYIGATRATCKRHEEPITAVSNLFVTSLFIGEPKVTEEMINVKWFSEEEIRTLELFEPTRREFEKYGIKTLIDATRVGISELDIFKLELTDLVIREFSEMNIKEYDDSIFKLLGLFTIERLNEITRFRLSKRKLEDLQKELISIWNNTEIWAKCCGDVIVNALGNKHTKDCFTESETALLVSIRED